MRCPERRRRRRSVSATAVTSDPAPCSTDAFEKRVSPLCWYAATLSRRQRADSSVPDRIGSTGGTGASWVGLGMCALGRRSLPCWAATCGPLHGTKMAPLPYTTTTHTHAHTRARAAPARVLGVRRNSVLIDACNPARPRTMRTAGINDTRKRAVGPRNKPCNHAVTMDMCRQSRLGHRGLLNFF